MNRSDEELCLAALRGDERAVELLFARHRPRLRRMVSMRMHPLLVKRCDASDVVQDALADATRRLPEYLQSPKVPFFVWLRQIGLDRLGDSHRRHLRAQARSVFREEDVSLSDESVEALAEQLAGPARAATQQLAREERRQRVRKCLEQMSEADRNLVLLRFVEQLKIAELAASLAISESAAKSRLRRALERLLALYGNESSDSSSGAP